jgi:plastocyanin
MRRASAALVVLAIACAAAFAAPAGSAGSSEAQVSAKDRCKHHHRKHRHKRCHKRPENGTTTGAGDGAGSTTSGPPGRLLATEREISPSQLQLQLSRASLAAGSTIVEQYNAGSDPHNLILEKDGQVGFAYPTLDPGGDQKQTITLTRGTWTLYCSLLDHRSLGMQATLTVN